MRISLKSLMFLFVLVGMGASIVLLDRQRKKLKQQRDVVIEINQDLTDSHEKMKVIFDARTNEVKRLRDEMGKTMANTDLAQRQVKQLTAQIKTDTLKADVLLSKAIEAETKAYKDELTYLTEQTYELKKEVAALKADKSKGEQ